MKLNLGCCDSHMPGYVNVDRMQPADVVTDLSKPWPWEDNSVDEIVARDIIEHLPDKILTMNEIWRVLKPGGVAKILVPTTDGPGAWQDPTHLSWWHRNSFWYYTAGEPHRERFGDHYGVKARFRVLYEQHQAYLTIISLDIHLEAVK